MLRLTSALLVLIGISSPCSVFAEESNPQTIVLAEGELQVVAPQDWQLVAPKNNLIEKELSIASPDGTTAARLTIMTAGGSVDANVSRWVGQFQGTEGGADRGAAKIDNQTMEGTVVTFIDISGTYLEGRPFGPKTPRMDYRMLAAIAETSEAGNYFFKLVGPQVTVEPAAESFRAMVLSLEKR